MALNPEFFSAFSVFETCVSPDPAQHRQNLLALFKMLLSINKLERFVIQPPVLHAMFGEDPYMILQMELAKQQEGVTISMDLARAGPLCPTFTSPDLGKVVDAFIGWLQKGRCRECGEWNAHDCPALYYSILFNKPPTVCAICLESTSGYTRLRCQHAYHFNCLLKLEDPRCPTCRKELDCCERAALDLDHDHLDDIDDDDDDDL